MMPLDLERAAINIHPGQWAVEDRRPIATLLGSCVAVCMFDPQLRLGGVNHFMLPMQTRSTENEYDALLRGDYAMEVLVNAMLERGAAKPRITAKAFGGGNVVSALQRSIGENNAAFARDWLARESIPLVSCDFGGVWARKLIFDPATGDAYCRRIEVAESISTRIVAEEGTYHRTLAAPGPRDRIELF